MFVEKYYEIQIFKKYINRSINKHNIRLIIIKNRVMKHLRLLLHFNNR